LLGLSLPSPRSPLMDMSSTPVVAGGVKRLPILDSAAVHDQLSESAPPTTEVKMAWGEQRIFRPLLKGSYRGSSRSTSVSITSSRSGSSVARSYAAGSACQAIRAGRTVSQTRPSSKDTGSYNFRFHSEPTGSYKVRFHSEPSDSEAEFDSSSATTRSRQEIAEAAEDYDRLAREVEPLGAKSLPRVVKSFREDLTQRLKPMATKAWQDPAEAFRERFEQNIFSDPFFDPPADDWMDELITRDRRTSKKLPPMNMALAPLEGTPPATRRHVSKKSARFEADQDAQ